MASMPVHTDRATVTSLSQQMGCMGFNSSVNMVRLQ